MGDGSAELDIDTVHVTFTIYTSASPDDLRKLVQSAVKDCLPYQSLHRVIGDKLHLDIVIM